MKIVDGVGMRELFGKGKKRETARERTQEPSKETVRVGTREPSNEWRFQKKKAEGREVEEKEEGEVQKEEMVKKSVKRAL